MRYNRKTSIKKEISLVFSEVLEHAGVFKRDGKGQKALERFISSFNK